MSIRVSQRQMYTTMVDRMNYSVSDMMESNIQASSQKKINRPSDDPYGAAEVLGHRSALSMIEQYKDNLSAAEGWLSLADSTLGQMHENLTRLFTLAEQSATGTLSADQRTDISYEARQIFEQLLAFSNTKFNGNYIFAGHKTTNPPFDASIGITTDDPGMNGVKYVSSGGAASSIAVRFTESDTLLNQPDFEYSLDSGKTWQTGTWDATAAPGVPTLLAGSVKIAMDTAANPAASTTAYDPAQGEKTGNGTWLIARPAAEYKGDDNDAIVVQPYSTPIAATATGAFFRDTAVRIDSATTGGTVNYSYSFDDGRTWIQATTPEAGANTTLPVPGGFLNLTAGLPDPLPADGQQFIIRPHRADIDLTIGNHSNITVNLVGKDVFGGLYAPPFSTTGAQPVYDGDGRNMFEVVGRFVGALETNSQEGCQRALEEIKSSMVNILNYRTEIGGRENRVTSAREQLENLALDEEERLSYVEDVDFTALMTKMSQQQLAYNSVLKSSSMIMQMSLMNFL